jgi:hypothetical protein
MTDHESTSATKRRKIRKGAFSCWECKNRKTRCQLEPGTSTACLFCQRRGLACLSQEFPNPVDSERMTVEVLDVSQDDVVGSSAEQRPLERAWRLPAEVSGVVEEPAKRPLSYLQASDNTRLPIPLFLNPEPTIIHLRSILPDANTATLIMTQGKFFSLPIHARSHCLQKATSSIQSVETSVRISGLATPSAHPLHFARKLIQLGISLQQLDSSTADKLKIHLKESVLDVARRYVENASRYVTSQDSLVQSQDGLETLILEAYYYINTGNLRFAWLSIRKALSIAQLMRLSQPDGMVGGGGETVWFRLVYGDRIMSFMLGLPCAIWEDQFVAENLLAKVTPVEELKRIHVIVLGRIIARNVRIQRRRREGNEDNDYDEYEETQDLDYTIKQATKSFPAAWWTSSVLRNGASDAEIMNGTACLLGQLHHYFYLAVIHQPYVVHSILSKSFINNGRTTNSQPNYSYNQITALSASREALSRFLILRNFYQALSYRSLDDKAYFAAIIVLLSHINGHRLGRGNVLDHQRPQDLKLLNDTIICIESASPLSKVSLTSISLQTLKRLMAIETECAAGASYEVWVEDDGVDKGTSELMTSKEGLKIKLPYLGTLRIASQWLINNHSAHSSLSAAPPETLTLSNLESTGLANSQNSSALPGLSPQMLDLHRPLIYHIHDNESEISTLLDPTTTSSIPSVPVRNLPSPDKVFINENWPFEDGDTAFLNEWIGGEI